MGINRFFYPQLIIGSLLMISLFSGTQTLAQDKMEPYLQDPIVLDSAYSMVIPVQYNSSFFSSTRLGSYYANLVFYNIKTDSSKRLFIKDTYIMDFRAPAYSYSKFGVRDRQHKNTTGQWILLRVKDVDYNRNGQLDRHDPDILYVTDIYGNNLRCLSTRDESVVAIQVFEKQNFALIKFQRDKDRNKKYEYSDEDYFYLKLDLTTLTFGNRIEMK